MNTGIHISNNISQFDFLSDSNGSRRKKAIYKNTKMPSSLYEPLPGEDKQTEALLLSGSSRSYILKKAPRTNNILKNLVGAGCGVCDLGRNGEFSHSGHLRKIAAMKIQLL